MNRAPTIRVPQSVTQERKKLAKVLGVHETKSFIIFDKIVCEILKCKKKKGNIKLDINYRY